MKTTRPISQRELLRLRNQNSQAIRAVLESPDSYTDRQVSIPERLTRSASDRLVKLERLAQAMKRSLNKQK